MKENLLYMYHAALDTSGQSAAFALANGEDNTILIPNHLITAGTESNRILSKILEILRRHAIDLREISSWTVGIGPGSFTGIRVGIAMVKGVCAGTGGRYRGLPSSLPLAIQAASTNKEIIGVLHDGRNDEMILSPYTKKQGKIHPIYEPKIFSIRELDRSGIPELTLVRDERMIAKLSKLTTPVKLLDSVNVEGFINPHGWSWPTSNKESETSSEPIYVRPAVFNRN